MMEKKVTPDKILLSFEAVARQQKNRQNYLTIPKQYVDDGHVEIGAKYKVYLEKVE